MAGDTHIMEPDIIKDIMAMAITTTIIIVMPIIEGEVIQEYLQEILEEDLPVSLVEEENILVQK